MRRRLVRNLGSICWVLYCVLVPPAPLAGQAPPSVNVEKYEVGGDWFKRPLAVSHVRGRAVRMYRDGHLSQDIGPASLSLFTADSHKFVTSATTDQDGRFDFGTVPPGRYRLVARSIGFCTGNIPIDVGRQPWHRHRRIVIFFRISEIDICTSGDYDH
jgi:hypothetical protein